MLISGTSYFQVWSRVMFCRWALILVYPKKFPFSCFRKELFFWVLTLFWTQLQHQKGGKFFGCKIKHLSSITYAWVNEEQGSKFCFQMSFRWAREWNISEAQMFLKYVGNILGFQYHSQNLLECKKNFWIYENFIVGTGSKQLIVSLFLADFNIFGASQYKSVENCSCNFITQFSLRSQETEMFWLFW